MNHQCHVIPESTATVNGCLTQPATPILTPEEAEISRYLSELIIPHSLLNEAYKGAQRVIERNNVLSELDHAVIVGESGCGKTTLCDIIQKEYGDQETEFRLGYQFKMPVLITSIKSPVTNRSLARNLLRAMGDETALNGTSHVLTERLILQMEHIETKVIILDESHDLFTLGARGKNGVSKELGAALNWIKALINRTKVTVILMGLPQTIDLINSDEQLARRFKSTFHLKTFSPPSESDTGLADFVDDLLTFLTVSMEQYFDDYTAFNDHRDCANRLYLATGGSPARVKALVMDAACLAVKAKDRIITAAHFEMAFHSTAETNARIKMACTHTREQHDAMDQLYTDKAINPFAVPTAELVALIGAARV
ncbi:TniB family NTP-binding protein [Thiocapsa roseopersicina]|uniref:TniB protein n=1 Tax=Thiocapsa roseopersicina TaxID=1058 RepID=A0A1H3D4D0_THIRO|nr:TniB family NTP-binding protein [Thiocapsa roseopersicina]SDX61225.1 TniB protein [Thiocapsa roseopersicina]